MNTSIKIIAPESLAETVANSPATRADPRAHWAPAGPKRPPAELEAKFQAMRTRNWLTDRMLQQYQKYWHCTREEAIERVLEEKGLSQRN